MRGIHEGKVASLLIQAGAEISLVSRFRDGETRLTARATRFSTKNGIHLGKMMKDLAEKWVEKEEDMMEQPVGLEKVTESLQNPLSLIY